MMTNLFSVFDPSTSILSMSWVMFILTTLMLTTKHWTMNPPHTKMMNHILANMKKEIKFNLTKPEKSVEIVILSTFVLILMTNFLALYPHVFSLTSHLTVTLPLSISSWLIMTTFGWLKNTNHMMAHLLPQGTPPILTMFMVMIELISSLIRPITLCVRLTANLIAGHLLMTLLGEVLTKITLPMLIPSMTIPLALSVLETAVSFIQAYVFMTLITLYTTETK